MTYFDRKRSSCSGRRISPPSEPEVSHTPGRLHPIDPNISRASPAMPLPAVLCMLSTLLTAYWRSELALLMQQQHQHRVQSTVDTAPPPIHVHVDNEDDTSTTHKHTMSVQSCSIFARVRQLLSRRASRVSPTISRASAADDDVLVLLDECDD
jgi:hypothetical protein